MTDLVIYERALKPMIPKFAELLKPVGMPAERLVRTVLISIEKTPAIQDCSMQSIINSATTAAVLGLEVDGVTGQAYLIPFKQQATLVIGYKGFNTLAYRAGYTVTGSVVREADKIEYQLGTGGFVRHMPSLEDPRDRPIIAAWAQAERPGYSPIIQVVPMAELLAVKARSPGARKKDSPWNDPQVGFPAMCEKTAKRRLARSMPLNMMQLAAAVDQKIEEETKPAWIDETGKVIEGEATVVEDPEVERELERETAPRNILEISMIDGSVRRPQTLDQWYRLWSRIIDELPRDAVLQYEELNKEQLEAVRLQHPGFGQDIRDLLDDLKQK